ncbi:putative bifunctional diguanylate cyclase/phosphodiesterase [Hydrogenovibrio kuenenii]|uniref:putative bifunctional diguanylate cyclase/phosphodiesterase n=1 Tax=Hydrogenovibrio kuenenii TaxID=63658 RepID=UPI00146FADA1|nr:EAL domain-containing protein [Hydrogenovibrio kuenenii]
MIKESDQKQEAFAFLFLDLDLFKTVNDSLGHHIGDELLKKVGRLLENNLEDDDFVARVGGDEFILLLHNYDHASHVIETIERMQSQLSRPFQIQEHTINISSSVGVAFYPHDGKDFIRLMQCSDIAMYEAKKKGRAQYYFYTDELNQQVQKTISLEKEMSQALKNGHFELYYQPKVDMRSNRILGAEALIRWIKPDGTLIPPIEFIPLAEENGFIVELGQWILEQGVKQLYDWQQRGLDINLSINIATKQLIADSFEQEFRHLLQTYPVEPSKLDIEITEYLFFEQSQQNYQVLKNIQTLGVTVSLDDFGTGYSSLSYLKKFPINCLKIDKSFVDDYSSKQGAVFIETIVKMAKSLNMTVVAEGVETISQLEYLKQVGCDIYQGYYCSRPLPETDFYHFLDVHHTETSISQEA